MARYTSFRLAALLALTLLVLGLGSAAAQTPTGSIAGQVSDPQGRPVAGAVVTVTADTLQGAQRATTSVNGDYLFKLLPPGTYTVSFEKTGFALTSSTRAVAVLEAVTIDVALQAAAVKESVTVVSGSQPFIQTIEGATSVRQSVLDQLPTSRTMLSAVNLSPSVHATGPSGNYSISGAMSFENSFMVNGVQVQDNLRGNPFTLFIEDAIQETTVSTSSISAEYGRFTGGIVNTLTKSGGNIFSGSFRESLTNDSWRAVSPFGEPKRDSTIPTSEFTLGGPIVKDRVWFFGAGRLVDSKVARETGYARTPYTAEQNQKRFEGKLTVSPGIGQRIEASYIGISDKFKNSAWPSSSGVMDLASLTNPSNPQLLAGLHYAGTFGSRLFLEAQYSTRRLTFQQSGGLQTDRINGTPIQDQSTGAYFWAPNFCGVCADERRDNNSLLLKGSYFVSTKSGSHDIAFGYDGFNDKTLSDNHQSGSDYHVWATGSLIDNDVVYPVIEPGGSTYIIYWPVQQASKGTNFRTNSLFVNDAWTAGRRLSLNLGLRYDKNAGRDASGALVAKDSIFSPRLGLSWDPTGNGRTSVRVGFSRYVAAVNNTVAGSASGAGNPAIIAYAYDGAPINDGAEPLVGSADALRRVFAWFDAEKADPTFGPFYAEIPGLATKIDGSLKSPHSDEISVGVSQQVSRRASVRADFINRTYHDLYAKRVDTTTGMVFDDFGQPYDVKLLQNSEALKRQYRGLSLMGTYKVTKSLSIAGNYTLSHLWGNANGENQNTGPVPDDVLMYPEYSSATWSHPEGDLAADQRHRARVWATYTLPSQRVGTMTIGVLEQAESGTPYGVAGSVDSTRYVADLGYATPPQPVTYFFSRPDAFHTSAMQRTDLAFSFSRHLGGSSAPEFFAQLQLLNAFNQFQVFDADYLNTTVLTNWDSSTYKRFNPFTTTPVEGLNFAKGSKFGQPISAKAYTTPRTFRMSMGLRF